MKKNYMLILGSVIVCGILVLAGCPKKPEETAMPEAQKPAEEEVQPAPAPAEAIKEEPKAEPESAAGGLKPVYFDFDRSLIRNDARSILRENANWLKANPAAKVRIEGNCDERGTIEYNQALGQRRASAAKKYLTDLGISSNRISLISYGKEKPVCGAATEDCWQQNRRDDFVVVE